MCFSIMQQAGNRPHHGPMGRQEAPTPGAPKPAQALGASGATGTTKPAFGRGLQLAAMQQQLKQEESKLPGERERGRDLREG